MKTKIEEIKKAIESNTNLKVSIKKHKSGSMKGYVTFSAKKVNGVYPEWSIEFARKMIIDFFQSEPNPTFCNKTKLSYFFGKEVCL